MQHRHWQRLLKGAGGAIALCLLPVVAVTWYAPNVCGALALRSQVAHQTPSAMHAPPSASSAVLAQWTDTKATTADPITINLVQQARNESTAMTNGILHLRQQIAGLSQSSFAIQLAIQSLGVVYQERLTFDTTWKKIGVPGMNQTIVQNTLINLQVSIVNNNVTLLSLQVQESVSGSITVFTPSL